MATNDQFPDLTREHRAIWHDFTTFVKLTTAGCIVLVALMAIFLA
ncbi:MAG: aa3-type cytochrome c oxidase subunit IV [Alphaproteobacteria bacterium]|nr:aa3-type cytochrome c oxidase subunit IV [Alphaproteobacteria bacterium]